MITEIVPSKEINTDEIRYSFTAGGQTIVGVCEIGSKLRGTIQTGSQVSVRLLDSNGSVSRLEGVQINAWYTSQIAVGRVFLAIGTILVYATAKKWRG